MNCYGKIEEIDTLIGNMGLGVDYYKGEQGIPGKDGKDGKDGSDQVYVGADEPTDERVKLWIDTDATPPSKTVSWDEIENKPEIPAPYTLPTASTSTLGGVKVDGNTITIADGVISSVGSTEPDAYIKDASVSGNTLTLTKKDNTEVVFTPSGGSNDIKSYSFSAGFLTAEEIVNLQYCVDNPAKVIFTIDDIRIQNMYNSGIRWYFFGISYQSGNIQAFSYSIEATNAAITGTRLSPIHLGDTVITQSVIQNYLSSWQVADSLQDSNLYNARELAILLENSDGKCFSSYYNFSCSFDSVWDNGGLGMYANKNFYLQVLENGYQFWYYDGSEIHLSGNSITNYRIFYKT